MVRLNKQTKPIMQLIAHEPAAWFLVEVDGHYLLDCNCSYSAVSIPRMIKLNEDERAQFKVRGRSFLDEFADKVQNEIISKTRDEKGPLRELAQQTLTAWVAANKINRVNGVLPRL